MLQLIHFTEDVTHNIKLWLSRCDCIGKVFHLKRGVHFSG